MRCLKRNMVPFYYCNYESAIKVRDQNGHLTSEEIPIYGDAVLAMANISPATGVSQKEQFGGLDDYDKVIVTCQKDCPVNENTVLFIDKLPETRDAITYEVTAAGTLLGEDTVTPVVYKVPVYDYIVKRVARSLNSVSIAVKKVKVS